MTRCIFLAVLVALLLCGFAGQASAQAAPGIRSLQAFSPQAKYMSLAGYLRWQYFAENNVWLGLDEAEELVGAQLRATGRLPLSGDTRSMRIPGIE